MTTTSSRALLAPNDDTGSTVNAGGGADTVAGTEGGDTTAGTGGDTVDGGAGDDAIDLTKDEKTLLNDGKVDDAKTETPEEKATREAAEAAAAPPEAYTLKAPDGSELDADAVKLATPVFKELGLNDEKAQKVVSLYAEQILPAVAASVQAQTLNLLGLADIGKWAAQAKADPEIGGAALEENMTIIAQGRDALATPALKELLEKSRLGNHPEVLRMFLKAGKAVAEGSFHRTDTGNAGPVDAKRVLYGEEYQAKS